MSFLFHCEILFETNESGNLLHYWDCTWFPIKVIFVRLCSRNDVLFCRQGAMYRDVPLIELSAQCTVHTFVQVKEQVAICLNITWLFWFGHWYVYLFAVHINKQTCHRSQTKSCLEAKGVLMSKPSVKPKARCGGTRNAKKHNRSNRHEQMSRTESFKCAEDHLREHKHVEVQGKDIVDPGPRGSAALGQAVWLLQREWTGPKLGSLLPFQAMNKALVQLTLFCFRSQFHLRNKWSGDQGSSPCSMHLVVEYCSSGWSNQWHFTKHNSAPLHVTALHCALPRKPRDAIAHMIKRSRDAGDYLSLIGVNLLINHRPAPYHLYLISSDWHKRHM